VGGGRGRKLPGFCNRLQPRRGVSGGNWAGRKRENPGTSRGLRLFSLLDGNGFGGQLPAGETAGTAPVAMRRTRLTSRLPILTGVSGSEA
jgi:hypothetical protein